MAPPVITVTRQYGSGGSDIARLVAERLRWELVDNQFVEEVARRAGVPRDEVAQRDEYVKTYYGRHRHDVTNYDLVVNAERLGFEGAAGLIVAEARRRGWK